MSQELNNKLNALLIKYNGIIVYFTINEPNKKITAHCRAIDIAFKDKIIKKIKEIVKKLSLHYKVEVI